MDDPPHISDHSAYFKIERGREIKMPDRVTHAFVPALGRLKQAEFGASLVYMESSRAT